MALHFTDEYSENMHHRLYEHEDFDALYAIEEICFQPPFRWERRYMRRLIDSSQSATWIAEDADVMAGFAIVEWGEQVRGVHAYLATIEVVPEYRGRGIGTSLLKHCENSVRTAGASVAWLHVDRENIGAISLYEAHGYESFGSEEDFYAPGRGALIYRKSLLQVGD